MKKVKIDAIKIVIETDYNLVSIIAHATVSTAIIGDTVAGRRLETLSSTGTRWVEANADSDYVAKLAKGELAELKEHLETFSVDISNFDALAKNA